MTTPDFGTNYSSFYFQSPDGPVNEGETAGVLCTQLARRILPSLTVRSAIAIEPLRQNQKFFIFLHTCAGDGDENMQTRAVFLCLFLELRFAADCSFYELRFHLKAGNVLA